MRIFTFLIIVSLLSACVLSDISISDTEEEYKIGQRVNLTVTLDYSSNIYGFFALKLICDNSEIEYFRMPLTIEEDEEVEIVAAPLRLSNSMVDENDECHILARFFDQDNDELMDELTDPFEVVSGFNAKIELNKTTYSPGDTLVADVKIDIDEGAKVRVDMFIDRKMSNYESEEGEFTISYILPSSVKSGEQEILFQIEDDFGNFDEIEKDITVLSYPNRIVNMFSRKTYYANQDDEEFSFKPVLYDQGTEVFDDKAILVKVVGPDGKEIASDTVISTVRFTIPITVDMKPGTYNVVSVYQNIEQESSFTVLNADYVEPEEPDIIEEEIIDNESESSESEETEEIDDKDTEEKPDDGKGVNVWKWAFGILVLFILLFIAYSFGKGSKKRHKKSLKSDKFYNIHKKEEKKSKKEKHPKVFKANPDEHEEDEEF